MSTFNGHSNKMYFIDNIMQYIITVCLQFQTATVLKEKRDNGVNGAFYKTNAVTLQLKSLQVKNCAMYASEAIRKEKTL